MSLLTLLFIGLPWINPNESSSWGNRMPFMMSCINTAVAGIIVSGISMKVGKSAVGLNAVKVWGGKNGIICLSNF